MNPTPDPGRRQLVLPQVDCEVPEIGRWLAALSDSRARTHRAIAGMGDRELDWVSPSGGNTIGSLLYHVAAIELDWLYSEILEEEFPTDFRSWFPHDVRDAEGALTTVMGDTFRRHEERLGYVRDRLVRALAGMSLAEFRRVRRLEAYDVTPEWVVHHLLQHEAEHRGQISIQRHVFRGTSPASGGE